MIPASYVLYLGRKNTITRLLHDSAQTFHFDSISVLFFSRNRTFSYFIIQSSISQFSQWKTTTRNNNNLTIRVPIKKNRRTVMGTTMIHPRLHLNQKIFFMTTFVPFVKMMYPYWMLRHLGSASNVAKSYIVNVLNSWLMPKV